MRRYPDREGRFLEAGKRPFKIDVSFSTEPSRPIRTLAPFALEDSCRRGLAKEGAVLMAISINGQVDVEAKGSNIEKGPPPETVAVPQPSPEVDQPARPERRPGMATVDLCVPRPVQVTLDTTASAVAAGKLMTDRTKVDVTARCPSREEILRREATALGIPPATLAKLIQSGERVLTLLAAEPGPGDEGPLPLLARASYALASSMAADCPQELSRKPPGAQAVLRGLMQKYAGR